MSYICEHIKRIKQTDTFKIKGESFEEKDKEREEIRNVIFLREKLQARTIGLKLKNRSQIDIEGKKTEEMKSLN